MRRLLRPLVRFCFRHGLYLRDAYELLKEVFLEEAVEQLRAAKTPLNKSRISAMTGLQRKDITRITKGDSKNASRSTLIAKIIGQWQTDPRFISKSKAPRVLRLDDFETGFPALVLAVSKDLNPASILFELLRIGAISKTEDRLQLQVQSYSPLQNEEGAYELLARDVGLLVQSVEENILRVNKVPNLHLNTSYDRIRQKHEAEIRTWISREGHAFHARAREFFSQYDQDLMPEIDYEGDYLHVTLGSFTLISTNEEKK